MHEKLFGVLWFLDSKKLQKFAIKTFKTEDITY